MPRDPRGGYPSTPNVVTTLPKAPTGPAPGANHNTPCPMCWMGRHDQCTGVLALAGGTAARCTCKQADHQTPTKPATPVITVEGQLVRIRDDLDQIVRRLDHLLETHDAASS